MHRFVVDFYILFREYIQILKTFIKFLFLLLELIINILDNRIDYLRVSTFNIIDIKTFIKK
jgi:hypothetical protein